MRRTVVFACFLVSALLTRDAMAQAVVSMPGRLGVEGVLRNVDGMPVTGTYDLTFQFFDTEGAATPFLAIGPQSQQVANGLFTTALNLGTTNNYFQEHPQVWLGLLVGVGGGPTDALLPRIPFTPAGYAFMAERAHTCDTFTGAASDLVCINANGCVSPAELTSDFTWASTTDIGRAAADLNCGRAGGCVQNAEITDGAVTSAKILDGTIASVDLGSNLTLAGNTTVATLTLTGSGLYVGSVLPANQRLTSTGALVNLPSVQVSDTAASTSPAPLSITGSASGRASDAPISTNMTGLVTNLNADQLDGHHGTWFTDAANLTNLAALASQMGTMPKATTSTYGVVQVGANLKVSNGIITNDGITSFNVGPATGQTPVVTTTPLRVIDQNALPIIHDAVLSIVPANATQDGYLTSNDWNTFANRLTTVAVTAPVTGDGTSGNPLKLVAATAAVAGYLTAADWMRFNNKADNANNGNYIWNNSGAAQTAALSITGDATVGGKVAGAQVCIAGVCQSSWPGGTGSWASTASNAIHNSNLNGSGWVGIGTNAAEPLGLLDIGNKTYFDTDGAMTMVGVSGKAYGVEFYGSPADQSDRYGLANSHASGNYGLNLYTSGSALTADSYIGFNAANTRGVGLGSELARIKRWGTTTTPAFGLGATDPKASIQVGGSLPAGGWTTPPGGDSTNGALFTSGTNVGYFGLSSDHAAVIFSDYMKEMSYNTTTGAKVERTRHLGTGEYAIGENLASGVSAGTPVAGGAVLTVGGNQQADTSRLAIQANGDIIAYAPAGVTAIQKPKFCFKSGTNAASCTDNWDAFSLWTQNGNSLTPKSKDAQMGVGFDSTATYSQSQFYPVTVFADNIPSSSGSYGDGGVFAFAKTGQAMVAMNSTGKYQEWLVPRGTWNASADYTKMTYGAGGFALLNDPTSTTTVMGISGGASPVVSFGTNQTVVPVTAYGQLTVDKNGGGAVDLYGVNANVVAVAGTRIQGGSNATANLLQVFPTGSVTGSTMDLKLGWDSTSGNSVDFQYQNGSNANQSGTGVLTIGQAAGVAKHGYTVLSTQETQRVVLDKNGNVGVGSGQFGNYDAPFRMTVAGATGVGPRSAVSQLGVASSGDLSAGGVTITSTTAGASHIANNAFADGSTSLDTLWQKAVSGYAAKMGFTTAGDVTFSTAGTGATAFTFNEAMRVGNNGSVGIANTAPGASTMGDGSTPKLDVTGSARFSGQVQAATPTATTSVATKGYADGLLGGGALPSAGSYAGQHLYAASGVWTNDPLLTTDGTNKIVTAGAAGITSTFIARDNAIVTSNDATTALDAYAPGGMRLQVTGSESGAGNWAGAANFGGGAQRVVAGMYSDKPAIQGYSTATNPWTAGDMTINAAGGNVGIGAAPGAYKLDVSGTAHVAGTLALTTTYGGTTPADPTLAYHAATKNYVDTQFTGLLGAGTVDQTLRNNGSGKWVASAFLTNNDSKVTIGGASGVGSSPKLDVGGQVAASSLVTAGNATVQTTNTGTCSGMDAGTGCPGATVNYTTRASGASVTEGLLAFQSPTYNSSSDERWSYIAHQESAGGATRLLLSPANNLSTTNDYVAVASNRGVAFGSEAITLNGYTGAASFAGVVSVADPTDVSATSKNAANVKYVQGYAVPIGTAATTGDTMYYNGTSWVHSNKLFNNGTQVTIGQGGSSSNGLLDVNGDIYGNNIAADSGYSHVIKGGTTANDWYMGSSSAGVEFDLARGGAPGVGTTYFSINPSSGAINLQGNVLAGTVGGTARSVQATGNVVAWDGVNANPNNTAALCLGNPLTAGNCKTSWSQATSQWWDGDAQPPATTKIFMANNAWNVGIGKTNPTVKLDVNGSILGDNAKNYVTTRTLDAATNGRHTVELGYVADSTGGWAQGMGALLIDMSVTVNFQSNPGWVQTKHYVFPVRRGYGCTNPNVATASNGSGQPGGCAWARVLPLNATEGMGSSDIDVDALWDESPSPAVLRLRLVQTEGGYSGTPQATVRIGLQGPATAFFTETGSAIGGDPGIAANGPYANLSQTTYCNGSSCFGRTGVNTQTPTDALEVAGGNVKVVTAGYGFVLPSSTNNVFKDSTGAGLTNGAAYWNASGSVDFAADASVGHLSTNRGSLQLDKATAVNGNLLPVGNGVYDVGASGTKWNNGYFNNLYVNGVNVGPIAGSTGTSGYMTKWTGTNTIGNSALTDNGTTLTYLGAGSATFGQTTKDYQAASNDWNFNLLIQANNYSSIGFHDAGTTVGMIGFQNNNFYMGANAGWGTATTNFMGPVTLAGGALNAGGYGITNAAISGSTFSGTSVTTGTLTATGTTTLAGATINGATTITGATAVNGALTVTNPSAASVFTGNLSVNGNLYVGGGISSGGMGFTCGATTDNTTGSPFYVGVNGAGVGNYPGPGWYDVGGVAVTVTSTRAADIVVVANAVQTTGAPAGVTCDLGYRLWDTAGQVYADLASDGAVQGDATGFGWRRITTLSNGSRNIYTPFTMQGRHYFNAAVTRTIKLQAYIASGASTSGYCGACADYVGVNSFTRNTQTSCSIEAHVQYRCGSGVCP